MLDDIDGLAGTRNNNGIPKLVEERDPTPLGDTVVSLGNMVVYYRIGSNDSLMKTKSFGNTT